MKKVESKSKKSLIRGLWMGLAMMAAIVLLTNCGSQKNVAALSPDYQLTDDCALLHLYRPKTMIGFAVSYGVHLDDEDVFLAKNNSKTTVRITSAGLKTVWGQTEARSEVSVDIQLGHEYYVRCGLGMGAFVGRPRLVIVDNKEGKKQFDKIH